MIWTENGKQVYVLLDGGTWQGYADTFEEGIDPPYDSTLPPPPQQPVRGFGKVWREQLGGPQAAIGWALAGERGLEGWQQPFARGLLLWTGYTRPGFSSPGVAYLLFADGTWMAMPAE